MANTPCTVTAGAAASPRSLSSGRSLAQAVPNTLGEALRMWASAFTFLLCVLLKGTLKIVQSLGPGRHHGREERMVCALKEEFTRRGDGHQGPEAGVGKMGSMMSWTHCPLLENAFIIVVCTGQRVSLRASISLPSLSAGSGQRAHRGLEKMLSSLIHGCTTGASTRQKHIHL